MKRTVINMLATAAQEYADIPYILGKEEGGWTARTFDEAYREARLVASSLISLGFSEGDRVAILAEGSPEWVLGEFGTVIAGCVSVPLSIKLLTEEVPFRINHSEAKAIFVSKNQLKKVLSVWHQFETKPLLLYLDSDEAYLREECAGIGVPEQMYRTFADLIRSGGEAAQDISSELDRRVDAVAEDTVVTISYTSGTTGNPKGIMLTHRNYYVNVQDSVNAFDVPRAGFSTLLVIPCDHSFGHTVGIYAALARAITISFVDARGGGMAIIRNIPLNLTETNPTFLLTVPALTGNFMKKIIGGVESKGRFAAGLFHMGIRAGTRYWGDCHHRPSLLKRAVNSIPYMVADALVFRKIRTTFGNRIGFFVGGGALLDSGQQRFFRALGVPVYQGYGLTEAAPVISSNTQFNHKIGTSGKVLASVTCRIIREDGTEAAPGERGEIVVRGESVMKGYFRNPEATAETIRDGWLHTGDLGYLDEDGYLVVTGREKALLISSDGEKYSPEEIEEAIVGSSQAISQVMIYNDHCKYTSALVTLDNGATKALIEERAITNIDDLIDVLREELFLFRTRPDFRDRFPPQWIPSVFQLLPEQFSEENRLINSSMKLVRFKVLETHRDIIDYMYTTEGGDPHNRRNREVLASLFALPET